MNFQFDAIGTKWSIDIFGAPSKLSEQQILDTITKRIEIFDKDYSRFRGDSLVTKMSREAGEYTLPNDAAPMIHLYHDLYKLTDGAFTPLIGQALVDAGYDAQYSLKPKPMQKTLQWDEAIKFKEPKLTIKHPVILDFGAAGKGYLIDIVGNILRDLEVENFCIDAGGDILHSNSSNEPLRVGLEHPENIKQVIGVATVNNVAICGSAGNRRKWEGFNHIIDPRTLQSPQNTLAIWTVAKTTMVADALSTCLSFVEPEKLSPYYKFDYLILYPDYTIKKSENFPAELFFNI